MKDLIEAYNSMYQLNEIRFTRVGELSSNPITTSGGTTPPAAPPAPVLPPPSATSAPTPVAKPVPMGKTKAGTSYEIRTPTSPELKNAQAARKSALASGASREDAEEAAVRAGVAAGRPAPVAPQQTTSRATTPNIRSLETDSKATPFDPTKAITDPKVKADLEKLKRGPQMNSYDYGNIDQEQLSSLLDAYNAMYKVEEEVEDLEEKAEDDPCWKGYTQVGMKKKGGREVPNCVPSKGVPDAKGYKEEVEPYDMVLEYLMSEGLASTVENAEKIMSVMSEEWRQSIIEEYKAARTSNPLVKTGPAGGPRPQDQASKLSRSKQAMLDQRQRPPVGASVTRHTSGGTPYTHIQR